MATPPALTGKPRPLDRKFHGSTAIHNYELEQKLGEGTFGEVYKARSKKTGAVVALKKILMHNEKDGFPITALREIKLLKMLSHVNVIKLEEMAVERVKESRKRGTLYMVTPYMDHDLSGLLDNRDVQLTIPHIKCYMLQLLKGLKYLHNSHILHRDMKAANLLISNKGILKIADFGLARHYDEDVPRAGHGGGEAKRDYTTLVVTRWYRPPELLLQLRRYTTAIDMWGAGCVFGEMFLKHPILSGKSDLNQAQIIWDLVGSPNDTNMPGWNALPGCEGVKQWDNRSGNLEKVFGQYGDQAVSLLRELLKLDWRKRINAIDALEHPYFKTYPLPSRPEEIPWFQDSHELDRRNGRDGRGPGQAPPPAPAGGSVGGGLNGDWNGTGPPQNGSWDNGSRNPRYPPGPPGLGPPGSSRNYDSRVPHDSRVPQTGHDGRGPPPPPPRRQPWQSENSRVPHQLPPIPSGGLRHPLPPHPGQSAHLPRDAPRDSREPRDFLPLRSGDSHHRDARDPHQGRDRNSRRANPDIDSYVPDYSSRSGSNRDRDRDRERRTRSPSRPSAEREDRYSRPTSRNGPRDGARGGGDIYDRENPRPENSGRNRDSKRTRSRSRSPDRNRDRDRDRARDKERERSDFYRR